MSTKLLLATMLLFSFTLQAQTAAPKAGTLIKTVEGYAGFWNYRYLDSKGNVLIGLPNSGEIIVFDPKGEQLERKLVVQPAKHRELEWLPTGLSNGDILIVSTIDSELKEKENVFAFSFTSGSRFEHKLESRGLPIDLGNETIAFACMDKPCLYIISTKGPIRAQAKMGPGIVVPHPNGSLIFYGNKGVIFLDLLLKPINTFAEAKMHISAGMLTVAKDGTVVFLNQYKELIFISPEGKLKARYKAEKEMRSIVALPNGNIVALNADGYLYFIDTAGKVKAKHFHDSAAVSVEVVDAKSVAYWNSTEVVFVDFQGEELGTLIMPEKQTRGLLARLIDGHIVAVDRALPRHQQKLYFIKGP